LFVKRRPLWKGYVGTSLHDLTSRPHLALIGCGISGAKNGPEIGIMPPKYTLHIAYT
jgi:hypothetical protein